MGMMAYPNRRAVSVAIHVHVTTRSPGYNIRSLIFLIRAGLPKERYTHHDYIRFEFPDLRGQELAFMDMIEAGVVDPTKVVRTALQNAASIAGLLITTEAVITELPEKDKDKMPPGGPGGHGGGGDMY